MSDIAIKVENLSKSYLVGHNSALSERYTALRDVITHNAKNLSRKTRDMLAGRPIVQGDEVEEFWALKDVSFEIRRGDRVGIIGRNGAGKSTLLKILSRITEPTSGRITINGRVASLLEVGTGFHPELSGRENIFLNGAILGMSRKEIQRKFEEIVEFAEVEKFLDTPVKRYSSGMYVRLAFAVAAHLDPEVLIVDEVLAVGDLRFQNKCLGKMKDITQGGRTVIFVSHNLSAINSLCATSIYMADGGVKCVGPSGDLISMYLNRGESNAGAVTFSKKTTFSGGRLSSLSLHDGCNETTGEFSVGDKVRIIIKLDALLPGKHYQLSFIIQRNDGLNIFHCKSIDAHNPVLADSDVMVVIVEFESIKLYPGNYRIVDLWLADTFGQTIDLQSDVLGFSILEGGAFVKRPLQSNAAIVHEIPYWRLS